MYELTSNPLLWAEDTRDVSSCVSQTDLAQVLSKPIIVIQTSENVTKLIGALLRYKNFFLYSERKDTGGTL